MDAFAGPAVSEEGADRPQHAQCRFPARYGFLKKALGFDPSQFPDQPCPRFQEWRKEVDSGAVSLVFADAFLNNPASMYGHTFLRLHRAASTPGEDLLDYTINFAAIPDTRNGVLYALKGLTGAFPGRFSTMPYYLKIQEYNNVESRDLWEYRLSWGPEKLDRLLRHAWEMGSTHFDYYFFSENCSYQLLTLLEGADPDLRLSERFTTGVIPTDTVRAVLDQPGLVESVRYRPSHVAEMRLRRDRLTRAELAAATRLGRGEDPDAETALSRLAPMRQALTLDSAHDYFRYRVGFDNELEPRSRQVERRLLLRRGALGVVSPALEGAPRPAPPEAGHRTARAGTGAGASDLGPFIDLYWRAALHDLADDASGYVPDHELEMLDARLRVNGGYPRPGGGRPRPGGRRWEAYFEDLELVRLVSLSPLDPWLRRPSWMFATGLDQARERGCAGWDCAYYYLRGGFGLATATRWWRRETWYVLGAADAGFGPVFERGWRTGGGPLGGMRLELGPSWRILAEAGEFRYFEGPPRTWLRFVQAGPIAGGVDLRVTLERRVPVNEVSTALLVYF